MLNTTVVMDFDHTILISANLFYKYGAFSQVVSQ